MRDMGLGGPPDVSLECVICLTEELCSPPGGDPPSWSLVRTISISDIVLRMSRGRQFSKPGSPLTAPVFYVLLSLSIRDRHGYDILKHVEESSEGRIRLGPGTLYTTLKRLLDAGLITELRPGPGEDARRRNYRLTSRGRGELTGELKRMEQAIVLAGGRRLQVRS